VTPHREHGRDPSLLVDGDLTNLGFHTIEAPNQNVTIDLGRVQRISRVVVYNRADCCQERAVPLKIEVSGDDGQFRQVAERKEHFEKWKADFPPTNARYVRLTDLAAAAFHLSEVEVY
jgi:F5/8 type C domain.